MNTDRIALTIEQAAAKLGVTPQTAREWARTGQLPARKISGTWYVHPARLRAWVLGEEAGAEAQA